MTEEQFKKLSLREALVTSLEFELRLTHNRIQSERDPEQKKKWLAALEALQKAESGNVTSIIGALGKTIKRSAS